MITHTAAELAQICGATLEGDGQRELVGPASLDEAAGNEISFARDRRFTSQISKTRAGAVIVPHDLELDREDIALLRVENPSLAFSKAISSFLPERERPRGVIEEGSSIDPAAELGEGCSVAFGCSIAAGAKLGANVVLYPGCVIGPDVEIGADCVLYPRVVVYAGCKIGERCILHAGCVIGSDGFGFDPTASGWEKVPHCGTVEIGSDVEIGANSTIDRGRFGPTRISKGCKLDNLVHLAHNVLLEEGVLIAAQTGVAGSSILRRGVLVGGQVGVGGHLEVGPGARLGAQTGVAFSVEGGKEYWGTPAVEKRVALRASSIGARLPEMRKLLLDLDRRIAALESKSL